MKQHKIIKMKLADLKPADYNPRKITETALAGLSASVERFGLVQPIIFNKRTKHVVGGHQRLRALEGSGVTETDVVVVNLPLAEEKALNVALNNPAIAGEFTSDLEALLIEIEAESPDLYNEMLLSELKGSTGSFRAGETDPMHRVEEWRDVGDFFAVPDEIRREFEARKLITVEFSGGKDSLACLIWARKVFPDMKTYTVFSDPGVEFPGMGAYVCETAENLGAEPVIVKPKEEWWSWLRAKGEWPSMLFRPCTTTMIHAPCNAWIKQHTPEDTVVITGSRAEEAVRGSKKTASSPLPSFGKHGVPYFHYAPCFNVKKPVLEAVIEQSNVPLWSGYAKGFVRTACWCCPCQRGEQACALQDNYPGLADEIRSWEKKLGPIKPLYDKTRKPQDFDACVRAGRTRLARAAKKAAEESAASQSEVAATIG